MKLKSYLGGAWVEGAGEGAPLYDPVTGEVLATASTSGLDFDAAVAYARSRGGEGLRALSYAERGALLRAIADKFKENYEAYKETALKNSGNTGADADIDVGGAIFTLNYYARLGAKLGDAAMLPDGDQESLSRDESFGVRHILVPRRGVAVHINAFNFPAWGLWEKAAVSLLCGAPTIAKPATATALLAFEMVRDIIDAEILPAGALSLVCGGVGDLLDHVEEQDTVAFTGSGGTAQHLRTHPVITGRGVRLTVEADSINATVLGPEATPDSAEFGLFIREVAREMSVKAGQKCTAIRRVMVPEAQFEAVIAALGARIDALVVGNPRNETVRMGPVVNKAQQSDVHAAIAELLSETRLVAGGPDGFAPLDADADAGAFVAPHLLACDDPLNANKVHDVEAFGPVSVVMPYRREQDAWELVARGRGCLAASVFTADAAFARASVAALAPWNGRVMVINEAVGRSQTGHGNVMPSCVHGGPGRAGGGEELGGLRGLGLYHQRTAIQGETAFLADLMG